MSEYTVHARAFHPDGRFGMGGMYFKGDSRGFETSLAVTSRIRANRDGKIEILGSHIIVNGSRIDLN